MEKQTNILVVDDEEMLREILAEVLESPQRRVIQASSGWQALGLMENEKVDLVISDVRMPQGTGVDLFKELEKKRYQGRFILVSGYADLSMESAYALGIDAFFYKPFDLVELKKTVDNLFMPEGSRFLRKSPRFRCDHELKINSVSFSQGIQSRILNVGRGGMFIAQTEQIPEINQKVHFQFSSKDGHCIEGVGTVRWRRLKEENDSPMGYGLSFDELSEEGVAELESLLKTIVPKHFIPPN